MVGRAARECVMDGNATSWGGGDDAEEFDDLSEYAIDELELLRWYCIRSRFFLDEKLLRVKVYIILVNAGIATVA
jgi:hypothetical protein